MKAPRPLEDLCQSVWLDRLTRDLLEDGTLERCIAELSVSGLTFNPGAFRDALREGGCYEPAMRAKLEEGVRGEELLFALALEDLGRAADLLLPLLERTKALEGWVSMPVSPLLAYETGSIVTAAKSLFERSGRPNFLVEIPGTPEGLAAAEEAIFLGVPVNVTLLFSREQYLAAAQASLRGIERRLKAGFDPGVTSMTSVVVGEWEAAGGAVGAPREGLGVAMATRTYQAFRKALASPRWQRVCDAGGRPPRLLWTPSGISGAGRSGGALAAPFTVKVMAKEALGSFVGGAIGAVLPGIGGDCEEVLGRCAHAGKDLDLLSLKLQREAVRALTRTWLEVLEVIARKNASLQPSPPPGEGPAGRRLFEVLPGGRFPHGGIPR